MEKRLEDFLQNYTKIFFSPLWKKRGDEEEEEKDVENEEDQEKEEERQAPNKRLLFTNFKNSFESGLR